MNVAGQRISLLSCSIAMSVWGQNMSAMKVTAAAMLTRDWNSVWRSSRSRSAASRSAASSMVSAG